MCRCNSSIKAPCCGSGACHGGLEECEWCKIKFTRDKMGQDIDLDREFEVLKVVTNSLLSLNNEQRIRVAQYIFSRFLEGK
jgi:hypothetical protein